MKRNLILLTAFSSILFAGTMEEDVAQANKVCKETKTKYDCYTAKRYNIFKKACDAGDKKSCKTLDKLRDFKVKMDAGDVMMGQSFDWLINNGKTSKGK